MRRQAIRPAPRPATAAACLVIPAGSACPRIGPPDGRPVAAVADGVPIVVCSVRGTLYAYCDACAACGSSLAGGTLTGERLDCPGCGAGYDVRSAGRSLDDPGRHLDPLPLLADSQGDPGRAARGGPAVSRGSVGLRRFVPGGRACAASSSHRPERPPGSPAGAAPSIGPAGPGTPPLPPRRRGARSGGRPGRGDL